MSSPTTAATTLQVDGHIVPKSRPRFDGRSGKAYHKREYAVWLDDATWQVKAQRKGRRHTGPVKILVVIAGDAATIRITDVDDSRPTGVRGDIDNIAGSLLDALQKGRIIQDDSQVQHLEAWLWDDDLELVKAAIDITEDLE